MPSKTVKPTFVTTGTIARWLGVTVPTIHRMVKNKEIPGLILGASKQLRFDPAVVRNWITSQGWQVMSE